MIESHGITIIRTNPDAADFDMNKLINQIYTHIIKSTKKSLIDDLSKRLLELEFKSNHSVKSTCLNGLSKMFYQITKNEKHANTNKTNKNCKKSWSNILFWL